MRILFCRIGWCNSYNGDSNDKPIGGGAYNKEHIGFEIHNFKKSSGKYYGYVESNGSINIENIGTDNNGTSIEDVLVVWVSTRPKTGGQYIVGWYKNATVYRDAKKIPEMIRKDREITDANTDRYNIESEIAVLIPREKRETSFPSIEGMGRSNIWYGNAEMSEKVVEWITNYEKNLDIK